MSSAPPDRDRLVAAARLCHLLAAICEIHYGCAADDSHYVGNSDVGRYYGHDGCGNFIHLTWHQRGAVALMFDHDSDRNECNRPVARRRPYRWLPDLPAGLADLAADIVDRSDRLATAGLWVLDGTGRSSDPTLLGGPHGVSWLHPELGRDLAAHNLSPAQVELAGRIAAATGPFELGPEHDDILLTGRDMQPARDLTHASAAADMLAAVNVRWTVPQQRLRQAQDAWQAELDQAVAARGEPVRALFEAARADRAEEVRSLVTAGADLDARTVENQWPYTPAGDTPLIQAVKVGATTTAQILVGLGADLTAANDFGQTALHWAVTNQHPALVKSLIGAGAEANTTEQHYGWTPLHRAALAGNAEIVDTLLTAGADPEAVLVDGRTPADCAHTNGHTAVIARLART